MDFMNEALSIFKFLQKNQEDIRLLNIYKGIPFISRAYIVNVSGRIVKVKADKYQLVCMQSEQRTYLQAESVSSTIKAEVLRVDFVNEIANISNFQFMGKEIGERKSVRVHPEKKVLGSILTSDNNMSINGSLEDISREGMALSSDHLYNNLDISRQGEEVNVFLEFPDAAKFIKKKKPALPVSNLIYTPSHFASSRFVNLENQLFRPPTSTFVYPGSQNSSSKPSETRAELKIKGVIANSRVSLNLGRQRVGLFLFPEGRVRSFLTRFINKRQSEIIREIKSMYEVFLKEQIRQEKDRI
ncbi:MAG: hypothetical protein JEZ06_10205 [Anaerolineaceae bacterium]|nr:hypothetical protein [Anaerolineaceae bacterium]